MVSSTLGNSLVNVELWPGAARTRNWYYSVLLRVGPLQIHPWGPLFGSMRGLAREEGRDESFKSDIDREM